MLLYRNGTCLIHGLYGLIHFYINSSPSTQKLRQTLHFLLSKDVTNLGQNEEGEGGGP